MHFIIKNHKCNDFEVANPIFLKKVTNLKDLVDKVVFSTIIPFFFGQLPFFSF